MRRPLEILTTLIVFAVVMSAIGWAARLTIPTGVDWLADRIGDIAVLAILGVIFIAAGLYAWRAHRPHKGKAAGK